MFKSKIVITLTMLSPAALKATASSFLSCGYTVSAKLVENAFPIEETVGAVGEVIVTDGIKKIEKDTALKLIEKITKERLHLISATTVLFLEDSVYTMSHSSNFSMRRLEEPKPGKVIPFRKDKLMTEPVKGPYSGGTDESST